MATPDASRAETKSREENAWRSFPHFEKLFAEGQTEPFLKSVENTCRQLDEIKKNGSRAEKDRASAALAAYGRTLELIRELGEMRMKMAAEKMETPAPAKR